MQDKSAMQQMIEYLIFISNTSLSQQEQQDSILNKATELLEVEKKNIVDAYDDGDISWMNKTAKEYYSTKYNNQDKIN